MYLMGYFSIKKKKGRKTVSDKEASNVNRGDRCRKMVFGVAVNK